MAQQSRKRRQTKHRGNAAGKVEVRGRTGRKPTDEERRPAQDPKAAARQRRLDRFERPPTWRGALNRAAIAAVFFVVLAILVLDQAPAAAIGLGAVMLLAYVPMSFYTDQMIYTRRQKKKKAARAASA